MATRDRASGRLSLTLDDRRFKKQLKSLTTDILDNIDDRFEEYLGMRLSGDSGLVDPEAVMRASFNRSVPRAYRNVRTKITIFLANAWKRKYERVRKSFAAYKPIGSDGLGRKKWSKYKKDMAGEVMDWSPQPLKYSTPGLATGFLRDTFEKGFRLKNDSIKISTTPEVVGFVADFGYNQFVDSGRGATHQELFVRYLASIGIIDEFEDILNFERRDWILIQNIISEDLINAFIRSLKT